MSEQDTVTTPAIARMDILFSFISIASEVLNKDKKCKIAILSQLIKTTGALQVEVARQLGSINNILVDGRTCKGDVIIPNNIININSIATNGDNFPSEAKSIMQAVMNKYGNEQIKPETRPLNCKSLLPEKPQINAPNRTDIIKYTLIKLDISGDLDSIYEKKIDRINETAIPINEEMIIPTIDLIGSLNSIRLFVLFLLIKNPSHSIKNMRENFII